MNNFTTDGLLFVVLVVTIQLTAFLGTLKKIWAFRNIFPKVNNFEVKKYSLLNSTLQQKPQDVLQNIPRYQRESRAAMLSEKTEVDLITSPDSLFGIRAEIINSINTYLLRNKGAAADFHLMKDVVERNCDAGETAINQTISLPLYIGLLGTFAGIVFGLFQISGTSFSSDGPVKKDAIVTSIPHGLDTSKFTRSRTASLQDSGVAHLNSSNLSKAKNAGIGTADNQDNSIALLLNGVRYAMMASFAGLLLTIINQGVFYKAAKARSEHKKNEFYTFLQTELLPLLHQNTNSSLYTLQSNLVSFNKEFKSNVEKLSGVMYQHYNTISAQANLVSQLERMNIVQFANANVKILDALNVSVDRLQGFNQYLAQLNQFNENAKQVTDKVNTLIARTDNFSTLAQKINTVFTENQKLNQFLQSHYNALDNSHQLIINSVNKVGDTLDTSLLRLKDFTVQRITEIEKIMLAETSRMGTDYPEKWKKLDNLALLQPVKESLDALKNSPALKNTGINNNTLLQLSADMRGIVEQLKKISEKKLWWQRVWGYFLGGKKSNIRKSSPVVYPPWAEDIIGNDDPRTVKNDKINEIKPQVRSNNELKKQPLPTLKANPAQPTTYNPANAESQKPLQEEMASKKNDGIINISLEQQPTPVVVPDFYTGWPTEMYFSGAAKSQVPTNTYFSFSIDKSKLNQATYSMHLNGNIPLKEVLRNIREIKYACTEEKPFSDRFGVNNIVTLIPGRAELRSENWVITKKAVIRYE